MLDYRSVSYLWTIKSASQAHVYRMDHSTRWAPIRYFHWGRTNSSETYMYFWPFIEVIPSLKLTQPLKIDLWKWRFLLENTVFRGYVSFKEGNSICDAVDGSEIRRENQLKLRLVVEIPVFTMGSSTTPGGCLGFLPSTIPGGISYTVILRILVFSSWENTSSLTPDRSPQYQKVVPPPKTNMEPENDGF